jgi:DNA-binding SARP family transcriptional activator
MLGPMEIRTGGQGVDPGPPQLQLVVAALAADAGRLVTVESLIDRVWDEAPSGARRSLHVQITRVRRLLEQAGADEHAPNEVRHRPGGYVLEVDPEHVDLHLFRRLLEHSRQPGREAGEQVALLRDAVALWRGEPLAGLSGHWAARMREAWRQQHLDAVADWAAAELRVGNPAAVIDPLTTLAGEHPFVERLSVALIRALCATGRRSDALDHYAKIRRRLVDELGADPGPELRAVHEAILRDDGVKRQATNAAPGGRAPHRSPAQLPADVAAFTGRRTELARLDAVLIGDAAPVGNPSTTDEIAPSHSTAPAIAAVCGPPGVGKTALAIHWARAARGRFPDGQLYVNLRGYDPEEPLTASDALASLLIALGVPGADIPLTLADRAARYRTELNGQRMLIVLDNASTEEQVRPLLPGDTSAAVLVTSRDRLAGLIAVNGAQGIDLDLLPPADCIALLRALIGARVDADPEAARVLTALCSRLPLALRITAEIAASRPTFALADLVNELADEQRAGVLLDGGGDPRANLTAVFSWSVVHLRRDVARTFRLLSVHVGVDWDAASVAALIGRDTNEASHDLDALARANLIHRLSTNRFGMHDLLRAYAASLIAEDAADDPRAALGRLIDYYVQTVEALSNRLYPTGQNHGRDGPAGVPSTGQASLDSARSWLDTERPSLVAAVRCAATQGWPTEAVRLSTALFRYLAGGHQADALSIHRDACRAARQVGDQRGEARTLHSLGATHALVGRFDSAVEYLEQAILLFQQVGERAGEAAALRSLGIVHERQGRHEAAIESLERALILFQLCEDRAGEAAALINLAELEGRLGRPGAAVDHLERALTLAQLAGVREHQARALGNLGFVEEGLGEYGAAAEHYQQALILYQELGHRIGEAWARTGLGSTHVHMAAPEIGVDYLEHAIALFREADDPDGETSALNSLGEAAQVAAELTTALVHHTAACDLAAELGIRDQQARAHAGLGHTHAALGDAEPARYHYEQALTLYTDLGMPDAEHIHAQLATLDSPADA